MFNKCIEYRFSINIVTILTFDPMHAMQAGLFQFQFNLIYNRFPLKRI